MSVGQPLLVGDPREVGGFRILARLGQGGQGVAYLGEAPDGEQVAVKVLSALGMRDPGHRERFVREAAAAQRVASFCTAQVVRADFDHDPPYIASEYVSGPSLSESVRTDGPRRGAALNRLAVATATALVAIHEAGIVHRDLKPANVLIAADGPRVIDFGIARIADSGTFTGSIVGTPAFMAPEQMAPHAAVGAAADVYSWGAVMVFAATGRAPFAGDSLPAVMHHVMHSAPDLGELDGPLRALVASCLSKDPAARPSSHDVLMSLLRGRRGATPVLAAPVAAEAPTAPPPAFPPAAPARADAGGPAPLPPGRGTGAAAPTGPSAQPEPAGREADTLPSDGPGGRRRRRPAAVAAGVLGTLLLAAAVGGGAYYLGAGGGAEGGSPVVQAGQELPPASPAAASGGEPTGGASRSPAPDLGGGTSVSGSSVVEVEEEEEEDSRGAGSGTASRGFDGDYVGTWVGAGQTAAGARDFTMELAEGATSATLAATDGSCTITLTLSGDSGDGYSTTAGHTDPPCATHTGADLVLTGGRLVIIWHGPDSDGTVTFPMNRS
ncbi:serine/threonine-protein kinase [Allonocardiopsis opalescens]|uniref:Serine/threonine protein kinase n=1 Tax=Allonocardiopsis opalescens TaxID=1144618 RepID=A0A2T0PW50_9ACTN|nr:serine/threonine-protein kinase [Allonocardiopsis opalescens]PRX95737.1 serine/threonine protein kinase [Allonocardiopsis opalescens]